ncbi:MAG: hypothetical protein EAZ44_09540 [Cytophagia bacterium]|nr:MAG: hypothetical protein EAZ44_09540 [Cytophagia bacterium]TAG46492.1 MAG: hypothetical protein EAZ31_00325 [Cytophagia bacterium]
MSLLRNYKKQKFKNMKKIFILATCLVVLGLLTFELKAQEREIARLNKEAQISMEYNEYNSAMEIYKGLLKSKPNELEYNYQMGVCLLNSASKKEAYTYLKKVSDEKADFKPELPYMLAQSYHAKAEYETAKETYLKAKPMLEKAKSEVAGDAKMKRRAKEKRTADLDNMIKMCDKKIIECDNGIKYSKDPIYATIENLGDGINSVGPDYTPLIPSDTSFMVFTSRRSENVGKRVDYSDNEYFEDVYMAENKNGKFSKAQNITNLNKKYHDAAAALSPDGNLLLIYRDNTKTKGDLYESKRNSKKDMFPEPKKMNKNINSKFQETAACITTDGNTMYFASDRPGGMGGLDIYVVKKEGKDWGTPKNLGAPINTPYDDDAPFLTSDGNTFYFSSKGHDTMGGFDVFRSTKNGDSFGQPENLGTPINGPEDDAHLILTDDGKMGYYVSAEEGGLGDKDIYRLSAPKRTMVKLDKTGLNITAPGLSSKPDIDKPVAKPDFKFLVLFDYDKSNINKPISQESCNSLLKFMQENPSVRVELGGHTCNIGSAAYNQSLSTQRAKAVANYMIERGIDANRVEVKGYNFEKPAYPNTNEKNRTLNRRTEFQILDK